jgi:hypothetical protein
MSVVPTWSQYVKTAAVLVTEHMTLCILINHKMEVSQSKEKWRQRWWDHHAVFNVGHQTVSDVMPSQCVYMQFFKSAAYSVLQYIY